MVQNPSLAANWFASSHEIPRISRNPKVHYRTHKRPPPVSIMGQPNPVHIPTSHLLEIHPNTIHMIPASDQKSSTVRLMANEVAGLEIFVGVLRFVPVSYNSMNIPYLYTFIHDGRSAVKVLGSSLSTAQTKYHHEV